MLDAEIARPVRGRPVGEKHMRNYIWRVAAVALALAWPAASIAQTATPGAPPQNAAPAAPQAPGATIAVTPGGQVVATVPLQPLTPVAVTLKGRTRTGELLPVPPSADGKDASKAQPLKLGLDDELLVMLPSPAPQPWAASNPPVTLMLDGIPIPDLRPRYDPAANALVFPLERREAPEASDGTVRGNAGQWSRLLGSPGFDSTRPVDVTVVGGGFIATGTADQPLTFPLRLYRPVYALLGGLLILALLGALVASALGKRFLSLLRDRGPAFLNRTERPYSLGRTQLGWWLLIISGSYLMIILATGQWNAISAQALVLLGIAGGTTLLSQIVDSTTPAQDGNVAAGRDVAAAISAVPALGGLVDTQRMTRAGLDRLGGEVTRLLNAFYTARRDLDALPPVPAAPAPDPHAQERAALQAGIEATTPSLANLQLIDAKLPEVRGLFTSGNILADILNDGSGASVHRLQLVVFTLILGAVYLVTSHAQLRSPEFDERLLTLLGLSGGVYVALKGTEKPTG
ncbi:MAG TPA: hypothetical protein VED40_10940 [Azospirillaceae bacterium]|nr:hypothetical protein [Azospirillaceae bacterium]